MRNTTVRPIRLKPRLQLRARCGSGGFIYLNVDPYCSGLPVWYAYFIAMVRHNSLKWYTVLSTSQSLKIVWNRQDLFALSAALSSTLILNFGVNGIFITVAACYSWDEQIPHNPLWQANQKENDPSKELLSYNFLPHLCTIFFEQQTLLIKCQEKLLFICSLFTVVFWQSLYFFNISYYLSGI